MTIEEKTFEDLDSKIMNIYLNGITQFEIREIIEIMGDCVKKDRIQTQHRYNAVNFSRYILTKGHEWKMVRRFCRAVYEPLFNKTLYGEK